MRSMLQWAENVHEKAINNIKEAQKKQKKIMMQSIKDQILKWETWCGSTIAESRPGREESWNTTGKVHIK